MARAIDGVLFDIGETLLNFAQADPARLFKAGARLSHDHLQARGHEPGGFTQYYLSMMLAVRWHYLMGLIRRREFDVLDVLIRLHRRRGIALSGREAVELAWLYYRPLSEAAEVDPDAAAVLAQLRADGLTLGVVSNTFVPGEVLDRHLAREGLLALLPVRVYSCDVGCRKPDRRIFREALRRAGLAAARTVFVGDSPKADVWGAQRAGMIAVLKDPLDAHAAGRRIVPDGRIRRLAELPGLIAQRQSAAGEA
jgi:putative hydrolase of the HAD superfamily